MLPATLEASRKGESMEPTRNRSVTIPARPESIAIDTARTAALVVDMPNDFGAMFDRAGIDISLTQAAIAHNRAARPMSFLTR